MEPVDIRELTWSLRATPGNEARLLFPANDAGLVRIEISKARTKDPWDIQLNQPDLAVKRGHLYRVVFDARSDSPRRANLGFAQAYPPWQGLGVYQTLELTREWQTYSLEFRSTTDEKSARIHFDLGGSAVPMELLSFKLVSLPDGVRVEPDLIVHGYYPAARCVRQAPAAKGLTPRFSVVIPTYQRRDLVVNAVRVLACQDTTAISKSSSRSMDRAMVRPNRSGR
jgi:Carbohydrate binding domain